MPRALLSAPSCYRLFSYIFFEEVLFVSHINLPGQAPDLPYRVLAQRPLDLPSENFGRDTGHSGVLLVSPLHSDLADTANEAEVGGRLNFLPTDRANIAVRLFAFGLCFLFRHNAGERNFKYKAVILKGLLKGLGRICVGEAHGTVVPDFKVSCLSLSLEGLVVVAALLASVLNLIHEAVKMDHLVAHRRGRVSGRTIEELGADVDFVLAVILALPNLLSRAAAVSLRGGLNGDDRFRQRVVEVDAIQNVEQALELSHDVRHFHRLVVIDLSLSGLIDSLANIGL